MRRGVRIVVVLLLVAVVVAGRLVAMPSAVPRASSPPGDAVAVVSPSVADLAGPPLKLGMGAGIGDRLDPSVAASLRRASIGVLRFGDIHADDYDWVSGCTYGEDGRRECTGAGINSPLDAFLRFAGQAEARPLIVVNGEVDDPQQAAAEVAYYWQHCVRPAGHPCPDPYWEIGASPANWKHFAVPLPARHLRDAYVIEPDQYAALVVTYAAAMRHALDQIDPKLPLEIVADEWIAGATDQSWTAKVAAIDTHYAPLLYAPPGPAPSAGDIVRAAQEGNQGRPGIDPWLQDLRVSLAQFSGTYGIIVGQWSIDANTIGEPAIYGTYLQAIFAAEMLAHLWQNAQPQGPAPLLQAIQYPLTGNAQEPFDFFTAAPRAAMAVYSLVGNHFGAHPLALQEGEDAQRAGIVAAAAAIGTGQAGLLLVNSSQTNSYSLRLRGLPDGPREMWWIVPAAGAPAGASPVQHALVHGDRVQLPPWSIAVLRAGRS